MLGLYSSSLKPRAAQNRLRTHLLNHWQLGSLPGRPQTRPGTAWIQRLGGLGEHSDQRESAAITKLAAPSAAAAKSPKSCPTLHDPIDRSPPGSAVPGILKAKTLEWVAISFSNAWKWKVKGKSLSHVRLLATPWTAAYQAPLSTEFSRQEYWSRLPWLPLGEGYSSRDPGHIKHPSIQGSNLFFDGINIFSTISFQLLENDHLSSLSSVQSCPTLWTHGLQHARPPCLSPTPGVYSDSCPLSQWCHPTMSSSVVPFSSCPQSFPASGSFPMSQFFASGGQSIAVSALASVFPVNIQDWFPLGWSSLTFG